MYVAQLKILITQKKKRVDEEMDLLHFHACMQINNVTLTQSNMADDKIFCLPTSRERILSAHRL